MVWGRWLVITVDNFVALVPGHAKVGDSICILVGCSMSVVLRSQSGQTTHDTTYYEFFNECFVYGMVDRRAMSSLQAKDTEEQAFELR